jgi:Rad3-related DNA helicase
MSDERHDLSDHVAHAERVMLAGAQLRDAVARVAHARTTLLRAVDSASIARAAYDYSEAVGAEHNALDTYATVVQHAMLSTPPATPPRPPICPRGPRGRA